MHNSYVLFLGKYMEGLKNKLQARKYWEADIKNQIVFILKEIKEMNHHHQDS